MRLGSTRTLLYRRINKCSSWETCRSGIGTQYYLARDIHSAITSGWDGVRGFTNMGTITYYKEGWSVWDMRLKPK